MQIKCSLCDRKNWRMNFKGMYFYTIAIDTYIDMDVWKCIGLRDNMCMLALPKSEEGIRKLSEIDIDKHNT